MGTQLVVAFVVEAFDGSVLDGPFIRSTCPLVHGCLALVVRCSMPFLAQAYSKAGSRSILAIGDCFLDEWNGRTCGARGGELEAVAPTEGMSGDSRDSGARSFSLQARTARGGHGQSEFL